MVLVPPVCCKFLRIRPEAQLPSRANPQAVGLDLYSCENGTLFPGQTLRVHTGWAMEPPPGYEGQVRSRSGLACVGVHVLNAPGTIDPDYRGEVSVILHNAGKEAFSFGIGNRIAQLVIAPITYAVAEEVEELSTTERGEKGFGSTGR